MDEDYFRHQQILVAIIFPYQYLIYQEMDAPLEWGRGLFEGVRWYR